MYLAINRPAFKCFPVISSLINMAKCHMSVTVSCRLMAIRLLFRTVTSINYLLLCVGAGVTYVAVVDLLLFSSFSDMDSTQTNTLSGALLCNS